jgi:hypothetical protein
MYARNCVTESQHLPEQVKRMKMLFRVGKLEKFGWKRATVLRPSSTVVGQTANRRSTNMAGG